MKCKSLTHAGQLVSERGQQTLVFLCIYNTRVHEWRMSFSVTLPGLASPSLLSNQWSVGPTNRPAEPILTWLSPWTIQNTHIFVHTGRRAHGAGSRDGPNGPGRVGSIGPVRTPLRDLGFALGRVLLYVKSIIIRVAVSVGQWALSQVGCKLVSLEAT